MLGEYGLILQEDLALPGPQGILHHYSEVV